MSATTQDLLTLQTSFNEQINAIKLDLAGKVTVPDFSSLQRKVFDELTNVQNVLTQIGDQFQKHIDDTHKVINDRLLALEAEATNANAQRADLDQRIKLAETSGKRDSTFIPSDRTNIQGAKFTAVFDQENGKISFQDWSHKLRVYINSLHRGSFKILFWATSTKDEIDPAKVPAHLTTVCDAEQMSETLYSVLTSQTEGEALRIVRSQDSTFNGLEAFRRLCSRFGPKSVVRGHLLKSKLSTPQACPSVDKVRDCVLAWESDVRRWSDLSGKTLDEDDKIGALIQICPERVQHHIRLNPDQAQSYEQLRTLVFSYAAAIEDAKPIPMDLGSFQKSNQGGNGKPFSAMRPKGGKAGKGGGSGGWKTWSPYTWKGGRSKGKGKSR